MPIPSNHPVAFCRLIAACRALTSIGGSIAVTQEFSAALNAAEKYRDHPPRHDKTKVLIEVEGGVVSGVHASPIGMVDVVVCDWDERQERDEKAGDLDLSLWFADGQTVRKFLEQVRINPEHYESVR